ncbi:MAG: hypothetical protein ACFE8A_08955 [Candidatus Hodarchaeota archaeon]
MSNKEKIVLIGAGSLQFGLGSVGSIMVSKILEGSTICLHDINAETLNLAYQACQSAIEEKKLDFILESTINRQEALKNATFIINSIEIPPRFELLNMDLTIPQKFGNKQITGENGGPGGFFHSLRVVPPILDICLDIQKICPKALFINFSNPMSRICLAIKRKFPSLKFVGLCHEYHHNNFMITRSLGTPLSNLEIKAGGLNHFGVALTIKYKDTGKDAYPDVRRKVPKFFESLKEKLDVSLIKYILKKYGYLPYTTDNHFGEYIHWAWNVADIQGGRRFWEQYAEYCAAVFEKIKKFIEKGKGARLVKPDDERAIPIMEGILTDANYEEPSVNLPNDDVFTNLPRDLVVECPAIINKDGLHAEKLGDYPKGLAALLRTQASVQDLVVEAILTKSKDVALQALLADPVVDSASQAEIILEEMLHLEADYLQIELE